MANMSINDKILSPVSPQNTGRPGERDSTRETDTTAGPRKHPSAPASAGIDRPTEAARPLSRTIGNPRQALHALAQLRTQFEDRPQIAVQAHAGIRPEQAHALTSTLDVSG